MSRSINGMAENLSVRLRRNEIVALPGCYDVLSAIILERSGFETVFLSGYGVAASYLGNPDIGLTTLTETAGYASNVVRSLNIPVIVDVDNGYGNEENVARTIYEMEAAGVAGIQLEDQVFPKRCGHSEGKKVVPLDHYLRKLEFALNSRQTPLCIIARTDSTDLTDAIARAQSFQKNGADCVIIDGLKDMESIKRVASEVPGPKQINLILGGKTPILNLDELQALGFRLALYSTPALYLITKTMREWLPKLHKARDLNVIADASCTFNEFQEMIEGGYRGRWTNKFLTRD